jgi:RimJ/RimL family protein N-acetyltransferase
MTFVSNHLQNAPTLETPRLRLRAHRLDDFIDCAAMWADAAVVKHIGGKPFTEEESWARLLRYAGHWSLLGFGYWVIEEKTSSRFVGEAGFADYKRALDPPLTGIPEIGWALTSQAHGRGFATEAVSTAVAWSDAHFPLPETACIISPENLQSIRVAEKCGYRESHLASYKGKTTKVFTRRVTPQPSP